MFFTNDYLTVDLGKITMTSSRQIETRYSPTQVFAHNEWVLDQNAIAGWFDGVGNDISQTSRPNQWGDFSEKPRAQSRMIVISGMAIAKSMDQLQIMRDDLTSLFNVDEYSQISVTNNAGTRHATVSLEDRIEWVQNFDNVASFRLGLYAPDPRVYGDEQRVQIEDAITTGGISFQLKYPLNFNLPGKQMLEYITNEGSVESWPTFIITGDFPSGFTVTDNLGHRVIYDGLVTMSAPIVLDMGRGTATQNGNDVSTLVSRREWFPIPPRKTIRPSFLPKQDGAGWCDIIYRDTWI